MILETFFRAWLIIMLSIGGSVFLSNLSANGVEEPACISPRNTNSILCRGK